MTEEKKVREGAHVKRYLEYLESSKGRHGRKPSVEAIDVRIAEIDAKLPDADLLDRVSLLQARNDLVARRVAVEDSAESGFVKHAAAYGRRKGITYETWREVGVPASVLERAGIGPRAKAAMSEEAEASAGLVESFEHKPQQDEQREAS